MGGLTEAADAADTVAIDDKGRVPIPKSVRDRLGLAPREKLELTVEGGEIRLRPVVAEQYTIRVKRRWGKEAFLCAGEAAFGEE